MRVGLNALRAQRLDAFVYDKPLLAWATQQGYSSSTELLGTTFDPQEYAFALPRNSSLRNVLDVAMLNALHSEWWEQALFRYLGSR